MLGNPRGLKEDFEGSKKIIQFFLFDHWLRVMPIIITSKKEISFNLDTQCRPTTKFKLNKKLLKRLFIGNSILIKENYQSWGNTSRQCQKNVFHKQK